MRHSVDGRKFGRNTSHRNAMFRNMANSVIEKEQIVTTIQKAKEVRRVVDRLITLAKKDNLASRRLAFDRTRNRGVVTKLFGELITRYKARNGGYTRVLKLSERRWGDAAEMAILELVDHPKLDRKRKPKQAQADQQKQDDASPAKAADPFKGFRKMFGGKKDKGAEGSVKSAPKGAKTTKASRKTMSGGAGNKAGGSGS